MLSQDTLCSHLASAPEHPTQAWPPHLPHGLHEGGFVPHFRDVPKAALSTQHSCAHIKWPVLRLDRCLGILHK